MKKMSKLAVAGLLVLGMASAAQAADIKASGKWQIDASMHNDLDYDQNSKENSFTIEQRIRTAFQFIANENLKGVLETQIGTNAWGNGQYSIGSGRTAASSVGVSADSKHAFAGANDANNGNLMLRKAYIDFKVPNTKVNVLAGFQTVNLPSAFGGGSAILDDQVGALVVSAPITDFMKITAGYARPTDQNTSGSTATVDGSRNASNVYFAAVPLDFAGSTNITPFGAYATGGSNSKLDSADLGLTNPSKGWATADVTGFKGYWGGVAFSTKLLDPFKIMADFNYGSVDYNDGDGGRGGWLADFAVDYTGLSFMTPEAFFVYSTGDDSSDHNRGGRMPTLGNPQSWTVGSMFFGDSDLISKSSTTSGTGSYAGSTRNVMGFWTAGLSFKNISFIDKLSHRVNLLYIQGTNDRNALDGKSTLDKNGNEMYFGRYLTTRDSIWEIDLNTKYQMYDELALMLNLGYANADLHGFSGTSTASTVKPDDSIYRATMSMVYSF